MGLLPFTEEQLHRIFLFAILGVVAAAGWFFASVSGLFAFIGAHIDLAAADAGYLVRHVSVTGVERMNEQRVYERVLVQRGMPMPRVDLTAIRGDLMKLAWVKDARVSRQLPDRVVVDIIERQPHAVLARPDRLVLVDREGVELEPVSARAAGDRLQLSGPGAGRRVMALEQLLDAAPALRPQVKAAEWVGNRRWNLTFRSGQVLALPQGDEESASALISFARLDGQNRLIGGKVETFDMRAPPRIYMRIPGRAEQLVAGQEPD
jgi:cell division protein FtsQ